MSSCVYGVAPPHQHSSCKQGELGGVGVQTDLMFSGCVRGEGETSFWAVLPRQNHLQATVTHFKLWLTLAAKMSFMKEPSPFHQDLWPPQTFPDPGWLEGIPLSVCHTAESDSCLNKHTSRMVTEKQIPQSHLKTSQSSNITSCLCFDADA